MRWREIVMEEHWPQTISAGDLEKLVRRYHHTPQDFSDGDLSDRLWAFDNYQLVSMDLNYLDGNEWNVYDDVLADNIDRIQNGTKPPPIVYDPIKRSIIDGTHRVNAAKKLGHKSIMAFVGRGQRNDVEEE